MAEGADATPPMARASLNLPVLGIVTVLLSAAIGASYVFVDLSLNRMGASAAAIGLNAAMPALGWLLATPFLPLLVHRRDTRAVLLALPCLAAAAMAGFAVTDDQTAWLVLRFVFGSSLGILFRLVEYWISAASGPDRRARNMGIYAALFCAGVAAGAGILPLVGLAGWPPVLLIIGLTAAGLVVMAGLDGGPPGIAALPPRLMTGFAGPSLVAIIAAGLTGLFEAVPYTLMPVYAVRVGMAEDFAAWTTSAFMIGQVLLLVPLGLLADRINRIAVLALAGIVGLVSALVMPAAIGNPAAMIAIILVWGGFAGSIYAIGLAMLADRMGGADLAAANASFGTLYAAGALVGPPLHGLAMEWHDPQGLMASSSLMFVALLGLIAWQAMRGAWRRQGRAA